MSFNKISYNFENAVEAYDFLKSSKEVEHIFVDNSIKDFSITKDNLIAQKNIVLPENVRKELVKLLALNYSCDCKVGEITNAATAVCTARPEEFFNEDGTLNKDLFCKAFKTADRRNGTVSAYKTIFAKDENVFTYVLHYDNRYKVIAHYVSNKEIDEFAKRISKLDLNKITPDDIKRIQADLWFLFRAWQESSIDVVKDKDKAFKKAFGHIIGFIPVRTSMKFKDILTNEFQIKAAKYNEEEIPQFSIDFGDYDNETDKYGNKYVETTLSDFQDSIRNTLQDEIDKIVDKYIDTNMSVYKKYTKYAHKYPELALTIANILKVVRDYGNISKEDRNAGKKLTTRDYAIMRAVIFNDADSLEIDYDEVVKIGIGVAGLDIYVDHSGSIVIKKFEEKKCADRIDVVEKIFGNMMLLEDAEIFGVSEDKIEDHMIKMEIEPHHIFKDVEPGIYDMIDGDVYDDDELIFDTLEDYTGSVEVLDNGEVIYYYDPVDEVSNIPKIDFILTNQTLTSDGKIETENRGMLFENKLRNTSGKINVHVNAETDDEGKEYGIGNINGIEYFMCDSVVKPGEYNFNKFYGIGGVREVESKDEDGNDIIKTINRNNMFLLLEYDEEEMREYIQSVTMFMD